MYAPQSAPPPGAPDPRGQGPYAAALPQHLSPQQLRDVLAAQPERAFDVAVHPGVDEPLRQWIWRTGADDVRLAIYQHYLDQRQNTMNSGRALPDAALRFDSMIAEAHVEYLGRLASFSQASEEVTTTGASGGRFAADDPAPYAETETFAPEAAASARAPETLGAAGAPAAPTQPRLVLVLPSGERRMIDGERIVIGRKPEQAGYPPEQCLVLADPARQVSGAHAVIEWDGVEWTIADLQSTNGTRLGPAAHDAPAVPGTRYQLPPAFSLGGQTIRAERFVAG